MDMDEAECMTWLWHMVRACFIGLIFLISLTASCCYAQDPVQGVVSDRLEKLITTRMDQNQQALQGIFDRERESATKLEKMRTENAIRLRDRLDTNTEKRMEAFLDRYWENRDKARDDRKEIIAERTELFEAISLGVGKSTVPIGLLCGTFLAWWFIPLRR